MADKQIAEDFAASILRRQADPLFSTHGYKELSEYLLKPFKPGRTSGRNSPRPTHHPFVVEIVLRDCHPFTLTKFKELEIFRQHRPADVPDVEAAETNHNRIVFLLGKEEPEWLNATTSAYRVSQEFYFAHAILKRTIQADEFFVLYSAVAKHYHHRISFPSRQKSATWFSRSSAPLL